MKCIRVKHSVHFIKFEGAKAKQNNEKRLKRESLKNNIIFEIVIDNHSQLNVIKIHPLPLP